jgi:CVNH domain
MRYITTFVVVALTMAFFSPGMARTAQQPPSGSYLQTCRDIGVRGSTLFATCQNTGGGWDSSELRDFQRCSGEIQNINGRLDCNTSGYRGNDRGRDGDRGRNGDRGDDRVPRGSYAQTCQNISTSGNTLQASCQKRNGQWRQTSLRNYSRCGGDIINVNGRLLCSN